MPNKLLVVDDESEILGLLKARLEKSGYVVSTASNGLKALDVLETDIPDLILLDIKMPEMDGWSFLKRIRKDERFKSIPVYVLSAFGEMQDLFQSEGVSGYITKPFNAEKLIAQISAAIKKRKPA